MVAVKAFKTRQAVANVAVDFVQAQSITAGIGIAEIDSDATVWASKSLSTMAAICGIDLIGCYEVVGWIPTGTSIEAGAGQDIDVQVEMNWMITLIGYGESERFVVERRQCIGDSLPAENSFFGHLGVRERIYQSEMKWILICGVDDILEHLAVICCCFQTVGNDRRLVVRINAPRLRVIQIAALTSIMRIDLSVRIARIVQVADVFTVTTQRPAIFLGRTRPATRVVDGQSASRGAVTEPVVADANFQVQLLADIV